MKALGLAIAAFIGLIALIVGLGFAGVYGQGWFTDKTANRQGETQKKNLVEGNGQYHIAAYNHFFDLCQQVQTKEVTIDELRNELKTHPDPQRVAVINASLTALVSSRADLVTQYNTDSEKSYTVGQFKSADLPYNLSLTKEHNVCHA